MFCTSGFHLSTWLSTLGGSCSSHLSLRSYHATLGVSGYASHPSNGTLATWCGATRSFSRGVCHGGTAGRCSGDFGKQLFEPERTHEWYLSHLETKEHQDVFFGEGDLNSKLCFGFASLSYRKKQFFVCFWAFLVGCCTLFACILPCFLYWKDNSGDFKSSNGQPSIFDDFQKATAFEHNFIISTPQCWQNGCSKRWGETWICFCWWFSTMVKSPLKLPFGEYLSFLFQPPFHKSKEMAKWFM